MFKRPVEKKPVERKDYKKPLIDIPVKREPTSCWERPLKK